MDNNDFSTQDRKDILKKVLEIMEEKYKYSPVLEIMEDKYKYTSGGNSKFRKTKKKLPKRTKSKMKKTKRYIKQNNKFSNKIY